MSPLFLVENVNGPAFDRTRPRREQQGWEAHARFMDELLEEGVIVLGGPAGDLDRDTTLLVVRGNDEGTVRARLLEDPWQGTVLEISSLRPWTLWLGGLPDAPEANGTEGTAGTSVSVMLIVADAAAAIDWYGRALGAEELWNLGGVAGLQVAGAPFFLHEVNARKPTEETPAEVGSPACASRSSRRSRTP